MLTRALYILLLLLNTIVAGAQLLFKAEHYLTENGLPSNNIQAIGFDNTGYCWLSTKKGLVRYDGYVFTQPKNVSGNIVSSAVNSDGSICFYSNNKGLLSYLPEAKKLETIAYTKFKDDDGNNDHFNNIFIDGQQNIWCTDFTNAKYINPRQPKRGFTNYPLATYNNSTDKIASFIQPTAQQVWIAANNGLFIWNAATNKVLPSNNQRFKSLSFNASLLVGKDSALFSIGKQLLLVNTLQEKVIASFELPATQQDNFIALNVCYYHNKKYFIAATQTSLYSIDVNGITTSPFFSIENHSGIIKNVCFYPLTQQLFVGTSNGFYKLSPSNKAIENIRLQQQQKLGDNTVNDAVYYKGQLFIATSAGKLYTYSNANNMQEVAFNKCGYIQSLSVNNNDLLLSTDVGLFKYDGKMFANIALGQLYSKAFVKKALVTSNSIWVLVKGLPVVVIDKMNYKKSALYSVADNTIFAASNLWNDIAADDKERVFLAGWVPKGYGLAVYNKDSAGFIVLPTPYDSLLIGDYYNRVSPSKKFHLLFSGYGGFNAINAKGEASKMVSIDKYPLANEHLEGIEEMQDGKVWFGTEEGIQVWNPATDQVSLITTLNGLPYNNAIAAFRKIDETHLIVGFNKSFSFITADKLFETSLINKLQLTTVTVNGTERETGNNAIELESGERNLVLSFSALNFNQDKKVVYRYKINNGNWQLLGSNPTLTFANFKNGSYSIIVAASDNLDNWQQKQLLINIHAKAHFYETIWFVVLIIFVSASIPIVFLKYRLYQLKKTDAFRAEISQDLHDDVGATLSSINILSTMLLDKEDVNIATKKYLHVISSDVQLLQLKLEEIIWSLKKDQVTVLQVFSKLKSFGQHILDAKNINFSASSNINNDAVSLSIQSKRNIYLIAKEALNNIAKHSNATTAQLVFEQKEKQLTITITDNGKGIDQQRIDDRNGIKGMYKRAAAMQVHISISTPQHGGTSIQFSIKL